MATVDVSRIASNVGALNMLSTLSSINNTLAMHQTRLSSGLRLTDTADEASISAMGTVRQQAMKYSRVGLDDAKDGTAAAGDQTSTASNQTGGTTSTADTAATRVGTAMDAVNASLAEIGALTSRLTFKEDALAAQRINTEAAYSRIMNADMAEEALNASRFSILQQTSVAMLAQANQAPQAILQLFR